MMLRYEINFRIYLSEDFLFLGPRGAFSQTLQRKTCWLSKKCQPPFLEEHASRQRKHLSWLLPGDPEDLRKAI